MNQPLKKPLTREEAKKFLEERVAPKYSKGGFSGLEIWADNYHGRCKDYLFRVIRYLGDKQTRGGTRVYGIGDSEIEDILDNVIL